MVDSVNALLFYFSVGKIKEMTLRFMH